jgi:hypothetical protein
MQPAAAGHAATPLWAAEACAKTQNARLSRGSLGEGGLKKSVVPENFQELRSQFPGTDSEDKTTARKGQPK